MIIYFEKLFFYHYFYHLKLSRLHKHKNDLKKSYLKQEIQKKKLTLFLKVVLIIVSI